MALPLYLAMTAAEFAGREPVPANCAWMACHYSCYGTGLSNCPDALPEGAMLIVNDRTPPHGHDPQLIAAQLQQLTEQLKPECILLDLQRPDLEENLQLAKAVTQALSCPVGISEIYAEELECPVFLPPPPLHRPLEQHLKPWQGREIWLEAALDSEMISVTPKGSRFSRLYDPPPQDPGFDECALHCRYRLSLSDEEALFTLWRTPEHLSCLLQEAQALGVSMAVGLYQELGMHFPRKE